MSGSIAVTQETLDALQEELRFLKKEDRPRILVDLEAARANGDLKENADYHAAKEKLAEIDSRTEYLEDRIARSEVITHNPAEAPHVTFGATVTVKNKQNGRELEYTLVSTDAVDPMAGKISAESPIGKALIGKKRGDVAMVKTPRGVNPLEIIDYK